MSDFTDEGLEDDDDWGEAVVAQAPAPTEEEAHHEYGPSASATWFNCAGAPNAQKGRPDIPSQDADEGSACHALAAFVLDDPEDQAIDHLGEVVYTSAEGIEYPVTIQMADWVQTYVDRVRFLQQEHKGELFVETSLDLSDIVSGCFGACDAYLVCPSDKVIVIDAKFGQGTPVPALDNTQLIMYAAGVASILKAKGVEYARSYTLMIVQPSLGHEDSTMLTALHLRDWSDRLRSAYLATLDENAPRAAGHLQCHYCRAREDCRTRGVAASEIAFEGFNADEDLAAQVRTGQVVRAAELDNAELAELFLKAPLLADWVKDLKRTCLDRALKGGVMPKCKLVKGRKSRKWGDEVAASKALSRALGVDIARPRVLISPAMAEGCVNATSGRPIKGSKVMKLHCIESSGKPTLVSVDDTREAIITNPEEGFNDPMTEGAGFEAAAGTDTDGESWGDADTAGESWGDADTGGESWGDADTEDLEEHW